MLRLVAPAERDNGRRLVSTRRLPPLLPIAALALLLALGGCGSDGGSSTTAPTQTVSPQAATTTAAGPPLVTSPAQTVTFSQAKRAIDALYRNHPDITGYVVQNVAYNAITRDKVLQVCHTGGQETEPASLESVRVAGCAPLIFYYYNYGTQRSVPQATAVARMIYWYAVSNIHGPFDPRQTLNALLRSWGTA